jgi:hypothetical protein
LGRRGLSTRAGFRRRAEKLMVLTVPDIAFIDEFGGRFLAGKVPSNSDRLAHLGVEALDRTGGVNDFSKLGGKDEEQNDLFPVAPPALGDRRIFRPPKGRGRNPPAARAPPQPTRLGSRLERRSDFPPFLPRSELH